MADPATIQAVLRYRAAARAHRREALLHKVANRPLNSIKEQSIADRITRSIRAEINDPEPDR